MPVSQAPAILAIEDDPVLAGHLHDHLQRRGFGVVLESDGCRGLQRALQERFDLVLMDILLPGQNGLEVLAGLRRERGVPVILMSALGAEQDRIAGFTQGADDYLPKPFSMSELSVRIDAVLRRVAYERGEQDGASPGLELTFDSGRSDVAHQEQWAGLTPTEYRLLEIFGRHVDEVLNKPFLYQHGLHRAYSRHDRSLDMHVSNIRRKLQRIGYGQYRLESVWGKGYVLSAASL